MPGQSPVAAGPPARGPGVAALLLVALTGF